jgi:hypothetical protein
MNAERPTFLGTGVFSWNARGYQFSGAPAIGLTGQAALRNDDPWIVLAAVLERARGGDFESLPLLEKCIRNSDNAQLWRASFDLMGDAGSADQLKAMLRAFDNELFEKKDPVVQRHIAYSLSQSLYLWTVPLILELYLKSSDRRETGILTVLLSRLLEEGFGPVAIAESSDDEYQALVMQIYRDLRAKLHSDAVPVLYGQLFSVKSLVARLYQQISAEKPDLIVIQNDRHWFEANTGLDCSAFFENGHLRPERATAVIEEFLLSGQSENFLDGTRYFSGNRISS